MAIHLSRQKHQETCGISVERETLALYRRDLYSIHLFHPILITTRVISLYFHFQCAIIYSQRGGRGWGRSRETRQSLIALIFFLHTRSTATKVSVFFFFRKNTN